ncbi:MAG: 4Fe-4S binding protein [Desulfobacterales bacterium]|nr:4Fe-4S binding protein [Desulfobacterales bacterium]
MKLKVIDAQRCVGCQSCMFACSRRTGNGGIGSSCIGIQSAGGMSKGFVVVVCRSCETPPCASVCPVDALTPKKTGGVKLNPSKCIGCGHCKEACILNAVFWNEEENKPMICIQCGICASYCPHGVLQLIK